MKDLAVNQTVRSRSQCQQAAWPMPYITKTIYFQTMLPLTALPCPKPPQKALAILFRRQFLPDFKTRCVSDFLYRQHSGSSSCQYHLCTAGKSAERAKHCAQCGQNCHRHTAHNYRSDNCGNQHPGGFAFIVIQFADHHRHCR